ncbi:MAG: transposase [Candidatus Moranbacteria bacterium]|nr:transposase [Candidatus Moranbacteria bacterium]
MKRREKLIVGEYYHVFNRGVERRNIFNKDIDFLRFLDSMIFFNTEKPGWAVKDLRQSGVEDRPLPEDRLVDIVAYCLNSNHFHFILRENKENGITTFMKKICTGHAMYFNKKYERSGVLLQGRFKSVHIDSNDLLLYLSAYVNCNSQIHTIENAEKYPWCSFPEYLGSAGIGCQKNVVASQFENIEGYKKFCLEKVVGMKNRKDRGKLHLEE